MLLRKLETYGFKSFADKLEIEFGQGITAIVGPNGSGKSNITDAIRWVLGEQNIRNLRGAKTEDIIFAGSAGRRALGVAEVALTFDNSKGFLPLDFKEVTICRRIFRSGDSEYYINKAQCRLKDIYNLLADTGLGRDSMAVISQHKIDEILNSKPEERRLMFEEAAGISRYKNRKKEALRKLEATEQNLLRISDITAEIAGQLTPLAESAGKTKRYNEIFTELTACQITVLLNKLERYNKTVQEAATQKSTLTEAQLDLNTALNLREAEKEAMTARLEQSEEQLQTTGARLNQITAELEKNNGLAAVLAERIRQAGQAEVRLHSDIARLEADFAESNARFAQNRTELLEKQQQTEELGAELAALTNQDSTMLAEIETVAQEIEQARNIAADYVQQLAARQNQLAMIGHELEQGQARQPDLAADLDRCLSGLACSQDGCTAAARELLELQGQMEGLEAAGSALRTEKYQLETALQQTTGRHTVLLQRQSELQSRLKVLSGMQAEYEGFGRAIKGILTASAEWSAGICGAVAEMIQVEERYVIAIETALGGALQHIITEDAGTAKQAIRFLKQQNLGRATFLPLTNIRPARPRDAELAAAAAEGALGLAAGVVACPPRYQKVVEFLLGRTVVATDIDAAQRIASQHAFAVRIVTLGGEMLNPGGAMTGGSTGRREVSFLSRTGEIEAIGRQLAGIHNELTACQKKQSELRQTVSSLEQQLLDNGETGRQLQIRRAGLAVHQEKFQQEITGLEQQVQLLKTEIAGSRQRIARLQQEREEGAAAIAALENRISKQKLMTEALQRHYTGLTANRTSQSDILTNSRIKFETLRQNIRLLEQSRLEQEKNQEAIAGRLEALAEERQEIVRQINKANEELIGLEKARSGLTADKADHERSRDRHYTAKLCQLAELQNHDKEMKELRRKNNDLQIRLHETELLYTKYHYEATNCLEIMQQHYKLSPEEAAQLKRSETGQELTGKIKLLEQEIAEMGPVNPNAIEDYRKIQERHTFLQQQSADLTAAQAAMHTIIKDIDASMSKQFNTAFASINTYFSEIFVNLFGGGQARLQLGDPENLLESGVEIIVQPPGKKLQNLVLLSGGERALTVIALLFALLAYRPAPFSVVDEIDAALDEANLERFSNFLKDYSHKTQFIVVTHRKGTMEAADVLHGVTIEEAGVSRVVSVKLEDKVS